MRSALKALLIASVAFAPIAARAQIFGQPAWGSPGAIGATTPNSGAFTGLTASTVAGSASVSGSASTGVFSYGGALGFSDTGLIGSYVGSINGYLQHIIRNTSAGAAASADWLVANDQGTATTFYGDFGMNSSGFTGTGALGAANAVYLYAANGDLALGTSTANAIHLVANGGATDALTINSSNALIAPGLTGYLYANGSSAITAATTIPGASVSGNIAGNAAGLTSALALGGLATQAANTVVGNGTGSTAAPTALSVPSCSTGTSALTWTSATGFGCNTLSAIPANLTFTNPASAATVTIAGGQTLTTTGAFSPTLTFSDSTVKTFPAGAVTLAGLSIGNTWTSTNTWTNATLSWSGTTVMQLNAIKVFLAAATSSCTVPTGATGSPICTISNSAGSANVKMTFSGGTGAFTGNTMTVTFPTATTNGYYCDGGSGSSITSLTNAVVTTGMTTTVTTLTFYTRAGVLASPGLTDVVVIKCSGG